METLQHQTVTYLQTVTRELVEMAEKSNLPVIAFILRMAAEEANIRAAKGCEADRRE